MKLYSGSCKWAQYGLTTSVSTQPCRYRIYVYLPANHPCFGLLSMVHHFYVVSHGPWPYVGTSDVIWCASHLSAPSSQVRRGQDFSKSSNWLHVSGNQPIKSFFRLRNSFQLIDWTAFTVRSSIFLCYWPDTRLSFTVYIYFCRSHQAACLWGQMGIFL